MIKQTSIDFLLDNLHLQNSLKWSDIIQQAKELHKDEIYEAFEVGKQCGIEIEEANNKGEDSFCISDGMQFYEQTFGE